MADDNVPLNTCVLVRGLSPASDEEALQKVFSQYGPVRCVRVVRDKTTRVAKGIAFVEFEHMSGAVEAVKGGSIQVDGQYVRLAHSKKTIQDPVGVQPMSARPSFFEMGLDSAEGFICRRQDVGVVAASTSSTVLLSNLCCSHSVRCRWTSKSITNFSKCPCSCRTNHTCCCCCYYC